MKILKLFFAGTLILFFCSSCYNDTPPPVDGHLAEKPSYKTEEDTAHLRNFIDSKGLRQGAWILYGNESKDSSYAPDAIWRRGIYVDSKEEGMWLEYFPNGKLKRKINFKRGIEVK
jgi:antitoxin component YwqK of YwqJK toxin-antitoxin module